MIIFELLVNGEIVARAGAEDLSVLSHTLTARGILGVESLGTSSLKEGCIIEAELGGLTSRPQEPSNVHKSWFTSRTLGVGDEVTVRIVNEG
jgi:hypothetical protein